MRAVFAELETVANIRVTEVEDSPSTDIRFGISNTGSGSVAYAYTPDVTYVIEEEDFPGEHESYVLSGDIWVSPDYAPGEVSDAFFRSTIIHELGHALGLSHPHDTFYYLERSEPVTDKLILRNQDYDQYRYTVMSYNPVAVVDEKKITAERENTTYSQLDIEALQFLYGESQDTADDLYLAISVSMTRH